MSDPLFQVSSSGPYQSRNVKIVSVVFYAVLALVFLASLWMLPTKIEGFWEFRSWGRPAFADISKSARLALNGHSNGYTKALYGYSIFVLIAGAFVSIGRILFRTLFMSIKAVPEPGNLNWQLRFSLYYITGSLAFSLAWLGLGVCGFLSQFTARFLVVAGWLPILFELMKEKMTLKQRWSATKNGSCAWVRRLTLTEKIFLILMILILILHSSRAALVPVYHDSVVYHLGLPNYYIQLGKIITNPDHYYSFMTQNTSMLLIWMLLFKSDFSAYLLIWGFWAVWLLLIWGFLERYTSSLVALVTVAMVLSIPAFCRASYHVQNDVTVGLFIFAHYVCMVEGFCGRSDSEQGSPRWLFLSGLMLGGAIGHKLLALPVALSSFLLLGGAELFYRFKRVRSKTFILPWLIGIALTTSPWFVRSYVGTGNPIYPFYSDVFSSHMGRGSLALEKQYPPSAPLDSTIIKYYFQDLLFGNAGDNLQVDEGLFHRKWDRPNWGGSLLFVLLFISLFFVPCSAIFKLCLASCFLGYALLIFKSSQHRYHLGFLVFMISVLFALNWQAVINHSARKTGLWLTLGVVAFGIMVANTWIMSISPFYRFMAGENEVRTHNKDIVDAHWMGNIFNERTKEDEVVLLAGVRYSYFFKRKMIINSPRNMEVLCRLAIQSGNRESLKLRLREMGVDHIVIGKEFSEKLKYIEGGVEVLPRITELLDSDMKERFATKDRSVVWYSFMEGAKESANIINGQDAGPLPSEVDNDAKGPAPN